MIPATQQPTAVQIPVALYNNVVHVLSQLPYAQVAQIMAELGSSTVLVREEPDAPAPPPPSPGPQPAEQ